MWCQRLLQAREANLAGTQPRAETSLRAWQSDLLLVFVWVACLFEGWTGAQQNEKVPLKPTQKGYHQENTHPYIAHHTLDVLFLLLFSSKYSWPVSVHGCLGQSIGVLFLAIACF